MPKAPMSMNLICRNGAPSEIENAPKLFDSIRPYVEEINVTVTLQNETDDVNEELMTILKKYDCKVSTFKWLNDFSAARNYNFSQATHELCGWIDFDDIMINGHEIPELLKRFSKRKELTAIWINYAYDFDQDGNVAMWVPRERIVRKSIYRWVGKLHENLICKYLPIVDIVPNELCHIKHNIDPGEIQDKALRNLEIIEQCYKDEQKRKAVDPRTVYDLGRSYHALRMFPEAKQIFIEFLGATDATSDLYDTYNRLADIAKAQGNFNEARDYSFQAIKLKASWPDAYHGLAYVAFIEQKWEECLHWLGIADNLKPPKGVLPHDPTKYKIRPLSLAQECYFRINKPQEALVCAKKALALAPSSEPLQRAVKMVQQFLHDQDIEVSWVKVLGELKTDGRTDDMKKMLECVPNSMQDHPFVIRMENELNPKPIKNRVVIYCHESFEPWSPLSVKTGVGGSEEAVINVSKELAKLGWHVDVYCDCNAPGRHDGTYWYNFYEYDKNRPCDVFIGWRMNEFNQLAPKGALNILWLHDKQRLDYYRESVIDQIDKIFVLSEYHRKDLPELPDDKFYVTRNGIDPTHFTGIAEWDPNKYIYASSPDRGLHKILDKWMDIKAINPKAELHVFYGFNKVYDKIQEEDTRRKEFKERILRLVEELPDIHWHGRVGHQELAEWFLKCGFWLYPCTFEEISCITAMKAQAAGCWPICSDYAALAETVKHGTVTKGSMEDPIILDKWANSVGVAEMEATTEARQEMRAWALDHFSWETLSKDWSDRFKEWKAAKKDVVKA